MYHPANAKNELSPIPLESLQLLMNCESKLKKSWEKKSDLCCNTVSFGYSGSCSQAFLPDANAIIKMARETLLQITSISSGVASIVISDDVYADLGLSSDQHKDFELALLLEASAVNFSNEKFDCACNLLNMCLQSAFLTGNPLQRVAYFFAKALQERITWEVAGMVPSQAVADQRNAIIHDQVLTSLHPAVMEGQYELPFCQISQFTGIQAILDNVASAKRVHLVDLGIKTGSQWPIMMQALADRHDCPIELLKITAVGASKEMIEGIGNQLSSFAKTISIPFEFRVVVSEIMHLEADFFELEAEDALAIHSRFQLASLLAWPDHLVSLVETFKKLNPCVLVITEIDACTNTPVFMDRFDAVLSLCVAVSNCLEECMDSDHPLRATVERVFMWRAVQNVITTEGEARIYRKESVHFWKAFLALFGMTEIGHSEKALFQADLLVKSNPRWNSCTLNINGKGLIIGWKGTPILSLTVWKIHED